MMTRKVFTKALCLSLIIAVSLTESRSPNHNRLKKRANTENCPTPETPPNANVVCDYSDSLQIEMYNPGKTTKMHE
ncbi:hypothetical protein Btru_041421 [Bulinus truncatus]|nr:hypothetical protein Btru_041421 [Bulinus truncatus]